MTNWVKDSKNHELQKGPHLDPQIEHVKQCKKYYYIRCHVRKIDELILSIAKLPIVQVSATYDLLDKLHDFVNRES